MDQIQQNFVKPTNHKKIGAIFGGDFRNWGKADGKLDLPATHEIHGSNPTKYHHTNKSQKNWGYFWWGFSDLGRKQQNQASKHGVGAPKT